MTEQQISQFMATNGNRFNQSDLPQIKIYLENVSPLRFEELLHGPFKSPALMVVIAWLVGCFGIDRFMLGQLWLGLLKLITFGGCGWWTLIDIFTATSRTRRYNMQMLEELL